MFVEHTINSIAPKRRNVSSRQTSRGDLWREFGNEDGLDAAKWFNRQQETRMQFGTKSGVTDGFVWRCKRKGCKTTISALDEK